MSKEFFFLLAGIIPFVLGGFILKKSHRRAPKTERNWFVEILLAIADIVLNVFTEGLPDSKEAWALLMLVIGFLIAVLSAINLVINLAH
ncbi:hypothetical protein [Alicyclobacillus sp. SO9]|uniref:hypothetical protein n=1 Tax=Alicyclobacillus sp. SO9 TaxID=2665646 RepID=UPI0018E8C7D9|nr:hypothetical protein [Alicyclobacillus sp. SO9]QQE77840.1 hypothetical protein GI364_18250 [Alicyclobacillus sp. SO9]